MSAEAFSNFTEARNDLFWCKKNHFLSDLWFLVTYTAKINICPKKKRKKLRNSDQHVSKADAIHSKIQPMCNCHIHCFIMGAMQAAAILQIFMCTALWNRAVLETGVAKRREGVFQKMGGAVLCCAVYSVCGTRDDTSLVYQSTLSYMSTRICTQIASGT